MNKLLTTLPLIALLLAASLAAAPMQVLAAELTVSAAASLTDAFNDAKAAFEAANPGVTLVMNYASSGALYRQIAQGAPVDVYASANPKWMSKAEDEGFIAPHTRRDFAANALVLVTPSADPARVGSHNDLTADRVTRIAIGTPETVPAGQYAKGSLTNLGLYETLMPKYIFAAHVRQVLDYVKRDEVDAGFIYKTDAIKGGQAVRIVQEMPLEKPVTYPIAVLKESTDKDLAQRFLGFLASDEGMAILQARGFKRP